MVAAQAQVKGQTMGLRGRGIWRWHAWLCVCYTSCAHMFLPTEGMQVYFIWNKVH